MVPDAASDRKPGPYFPESNKKRKVPALGIEPRSVPPQGNILTIKIRWLDYASFFE